MRVVSFLFVLLRGELCAIGRKTDATRKRRFFGGGATRNPSKAFGGGVKRNPRFRHARTPRQNSRHKRYL